MGRHCDAGGRVDRRPHGPRPLGLLLARREVVSFRGGERSGAALRRGNSRGAGALPRAYRLGALLRLLSGRKDAGLGGPRQHGTPVGRSDSQADFCDEGAPASHPLRELLPRPGNDRNRRHGRGREALGYAEYDGGHSDPDGQPRNPLSRNSMRTASAGRRRTAWTASVWKR